MSSNIILEGLLKYKGCTGFILTESGREGLGLAGPRKPLEPQRKPGKERVAAILQAASYVIAERGVEAATMAEIAARAAAPIGSLYRFFPNKQVLADALVQRWIDLLDGAFDGISDSSASLPTLQFADTMLSVMANLRGETAALVKLLDADATQSVKRAEIHDLLNGHVSRKLVRRNPRLSSGVASGAATIILQNMKSYSNLVAERELGSSAGVKYAKNGAIDELREMNRLYFASKLDSTDD